MFKAEADDGAWNWQTRSAVTEDEARALFAQVEAALDALQPAPATQHVRKGWTIRALGEKYLAEQRRVVERGQPPLPPNRGRPLDAVVGGMKKCLQLGPVSVASRPAALRSTSGPEACKNGIRQNSSLRPAHTGPAGSSLRSETRFHRPPV